MSARFATRPMQAADLDAVRALAAASPAAPQWKLDAYQAALDATRSPRRIALVVVDSSDTLAGFAIASLTPPEAELETICIASQCRRQGAGRTLLGALAGEVRLAGAEVLLLEVRASNQAARALYGEAGFCEAGLRRGYYADPVEDAVLLKRNLCDG